ncbi:hypothetical protein E2562_014796 [Oryza meyeriana var. granulata]|uniref:Uncharacterized protein n=1 Tax=Oryza meyeriana var. granulata TaxID=110450 RepID=A0A6G1BXU6_9ORYZ|nr:hypothetical protein E2562_014796 [Oryza meyeriana var. granulata]
MEERNSPTSGNDATAVGADGGEKGGVHDGGGRGEQGEAALAAWSVCPRASHDHKITHSPPQREGSSPTKGSSVAAEDGRLRRTWCAPV